MVVYLIVIELAVFSQIDRVYTHSLPIHYSRFFPDLCVRSAYVMDVIGTPVHNVKFLLKFFSDKW